MDLDATQLLISAAASAALQVGAVLWIKDPRDDGWNLNIEIPAGMTTAGFVNALHVAVSAWAQAGERIAMKTLLRMGVDFLPPNHPIAALVRKSAAIPHPVRAPVRTSDIAAGPYVIEEAIVFKD